MSYYRQRTLGSRGRPIQPAVQPASIPASVGGVNALDPAINAPQQDCFYTFNLMPSEYGLRLRKGYREWAINIGQSASTNDVRGVVPFEGTDPANNKLFACCQDGIYDATTEGDTTPPRVQTFANTTGDAGYVTWCEFTTDAEETYLFVACPENGLFQYQESTGLWTVPAFTGPAVSDIAFVGLHKQRLWVVEKNSTTAYYSDVASIAGDLTAFTFGSKFKYGGELLGIYTWTLDGGDGVDDYLVAISRGGDVLAYRGSDPSLTDWTLTGSYFVGQMPASRRITVPYAGELFILSTFGVTSLRDLVSGVDSSDMARSPSAKINRILRQAVIDDKDDAGWQLTTNPADGFLQIIRPWVNVNEAIQYNQNLLTRAWGYWRNVPAISADTWQAEYYIGSKDGILYIYDGLLDGSTLAEAGSAIQFSILTSFQPYGNHGTYMQAGVMRVVAAAEDGARYNLKAVYDYNISPAVRAPQGGATDAPGIWAISLWDEAIWSGEPTGQAFLDGAAGIGRTMAMAMRGQSVSRLTVIGWDVTIVQGGFL